MSDSVLFFSPIFFLTLDLPLCIDQDVPWCGALWVTVSTSRDGQCLGFEVQTQLELGALEEGCSCSTAGSLCCSWWYVVAQVVLQWFIFLFPFNVSFFLRLFLAFQFFFPFYFYKLFIVPWGGLIDFSFFLFLLAWVCLLSLLPCNNNELTSLVVFIYLCFIFIVVWLYNILESNVLCSMLSVVLVLSLWRHVMECIKWSVSVKCMTVCECVGYL